MTTSQLVSLKNFFDQFVNRVVFKRLLIAHFEPSASPDAQAIGQALDAVNWTIPVTQGAMIWLDPAGQGLTQAAIDQAPRLPMEAFAPAPRLPAVPCLITPEQSPLLALSPSAPAGEKLFLASSQLAATPPKPERIQLGPNATGDGLLLQASSGLVLARGLAQADATKFILNTPSVTIPMSGTLSGALTSDAILATPLSAIGPQCHYAFSVTGGTVPSGGVDYPILDRPDAINGRKASLTLSVRAPLDPQRTAIVLGDAATPLRSAFRTLLDDAILLSPQSDGSSRLVFNRGYAGALYLTLSGALTLSVAGGGEPTDTGLGYQILCGFSGVEYLHFAPGDFMMFYPDQLADVLVEIDPDLPILAGVTFRFNQPQGTTPGAQTVRVMVLPADASKPDQRQYYSEPDQSPFFAPIAGGSDPRQLGYFALTQTCLPDQAGPAGALFQFPLLPYAAYQPSVAGLGSDPAYLEAFECHLINPTRKAAIEAMAQSGSFSSHTGQAAGEIIALTPEGYVATFSNGLWQSLRIAEMSSSHASIKLRFDAPPPAGSAPQQLPQPLQEAFLTNQQFLVITKPDNLGTFAPEIVMDQWSFTLDLSANTSVGDYRNVMLFKSSGATVRQLAHHPELWTRYADFNDGKHDPDGRFISNWLVSYLDEATALYDGGNGIASLEHFCGLIDDPDWNGFLALRVHIDPQSLPDEIEALITGIDQSLFVAHHIGNQINHVQPLSGTPTDYALDSAMFGLVHYVDPVLGRSIDQLPSYIANPAPLDFKVLTLEAVFENAVLVNFSNKSLLTLNVLFGDKVLPSSLQGDPGSNTLVLIGTYRSGQIPAYRFATANASLTDFYLASNALERIEINRATMVVQSNGSQEQAGFSLSGTIRTRNRPGFDVLAYESLAFTNLLLDMDFVKGGVERQFSFDLARLQLALVQNVAFPLADSTALPPTGCNLVRTGSLLSQFPLQLTGFVVGSSDRLPAAMGYTTLATTEPAGIEPAKLGSSTWYALAFDITLGSLGAMGNGAALSAKLLLAWAPGGPVYGVDVLPALKIDGPGGNSLSFNIEGVIKFGAADLVLNCPVPAQASVGQFVLMLESIGFSVLSISFPPAGSTNIFMLGDPNAAQAGQVLKPTLGWFGGYVKQPAPTQ